MLKNRKIIINFLFSFFFFNVFEFGLVVANFENFTITANNVDTILIPAFTENSSIQDANDLFNYFLKLPNFPLSFNIYIKEQNAKCSIETDFREESVYSCTTDSLTYFSLDSDAIEEIYNSSITNDFKDFIRIAQLIIELTTSLCPQTPASCYVTRTNFIILTNLPKIQIKFENIFGRLKEIVYFGISSTKDFNFIDLDSNLDYDDDEDEYRDVQMFYIYQNNILSSADVSGIIFSNKLLFEFRPLENNYNIYIVGDETILEQSIALAEYLVITGEPIYTGWDYLSPRFYIASIRKNDSFSYQTGKIQAGVHLYDNIIYPKPDYIFLSDPSTTKKFSTSLVENYLTQSFTEFPDIFQWNIIITDSFPFWLNKTGIIFNSFNQKMDIYLISNDSTTTMKKSKKLLNDLSKNIDEIIFNKDGNASIRFNHILFQNNLNLNNTNNFPTFKEKMASTRFDYKSPNRWWIWLIIGCSIFIFIFVVVISFYLWRRRMYRKLKAKYGWAMKSGFTPKEAEIFVANGKELLIDPENIILDYEKALGKGVSAVVYEGHLNGASPVTILYPRLETTTFANCKVAMKIANTITKDEFEQVFREIDAALKIGFHRHICCLLGWTIYQQIPALIFEFIDGKDLISWIKTSKKIEKSDKIIAQILWQIADGMEHIASKGVVHKDLAARNILLTSRLEVKVADFGLASLTNESFTYQGIQKQRLPIRWMSPEALTQRLFSEASDIWSFGVLIWEIFSSGEIPYGSLDGNEIISFLNDGNRLEIPNIEEEEIHVGNEWKKLMKNCWMFEREKRPTFSQIKYSLGLFLERQTITYGYVMFNEYENEENNESIL